MRRALSEIETVAGDYQRLYLPNRLTADSTHPFDPGDDVRLQLVTTTCGRDVLVVTSDLLEIDTELSDLEVTESESIETSLEDAGGQA